MSSSESYTLADPGEPLAFLAGDLGHRAVGREVAAQNADVPARQDRRLDRSARSPGPASGRAGPAGSRRASGPSPSCVAVQEALRQQVLHHRRRAADVVQVLLHVACRSASDRRAAARGRSAFWKSSSDERHLRGRARSPAGAARRWSIRPPPSPASWRSRTPWASRMSSGLRSLSSSSRTAAPARRHSSALPSLSAGSDELYGSDSPSASIATAMVLAVYIPPHAPAPGHECWTMSSRCSSVMTPARYSPYDWNAEMMSRGLPLRVTRRDRAAVDHQRRPVEPRHRHHAARHVLVAAGHGDERVVPLRAHHRLDRVGDEVARRQRVAHAVGAHRERRR